MIIPGQCRLTPSCTRAKSSGSEEGLSSGLRTWIWTNEAPTSKASCVDSICSVTVTGTAGVLRLVGTEPVMATAITIGLIPSLLKRLEVTDCTRCPEMLGPTRLELEPERIGASPRRLGQKHDSFGRRTEGARHPRRLGARHVINSIQLDRRHPQSMTATARVHPAEARCTRSASIRCMMLAPIARSRPAFRLLRYFPDHEERVLHGQAQGISDASAQTVRIPRALLCRNGKHRLVLKCGGYDVLDPADPS